VKYDSTLKTLFATAARGLVRTLTGSTVTSWLNVELPRVNVPRMDLLGRLSNGALCNIEFQTTNDARLPERAAMYYLQARIIHREHVGQIVLYLGEEPLRMPNSIDTPAMHFQFRLIDIRELDGDEMAASGDLGDLILSVLARVRSRPEAIRRVLDGIVKLKGKERELALEQLLIVAELRKLEPEVTEVVKTHMPFIVDMSENRIFRQRYEKGLAEGEARGEVKGEAKVIGRLLAKRFGRLPAWARKRLQTAGTEQLDSWTLKLLDAGTLEEVLGKREDGGR
jgi:hypothetical protein